MFKRRWKLLSTGRFDPYPSPSGLSLSPSAALAPLFEAAPLALTFAKRGAGASAWQKAARAKLVELLGHRRQPEGQVPVTRFDEDHTHPAGVHRRRLYLSAWRGADIPVNLLWKGDLSSPMPTMICLTGTSVRANCAWGEPRTTIDPIKIARGLDMAVQAAQRGYLAVVVEQLAFGERTERHMTPVSPAAGVDTAHHALLVGRTHLGLWTSDLSAVIDWLLGSEIPVDPTRLHAMGHSAGGTTALFGAAVDTRIGAALASGCVGSWRRNLARRRDGSGQMAIPRILDWLEMSDVLGLVAPRPLLVVSGMKDHIWPFEEAARVVAEARPCYEAFGASGRLAAVSGRAGHLPYPDDAWAGFNRVLSDQPSAPVNTKDRW